MGSADLVFDHMGAEEKAHPLQLLPGSSSPPTGELTLIDGVRGADHQERVSCLLGPHGQMAPSIRW